LFFSKVGGITLTFYQELQLNQAGSKKLIRESNSTKEKWYHEGVFLFKILLTVAFCFVSFSKGESWI